MKNEFIEITEEDLQILEKILEKIDPVDLAINVGLADVSMKAGTHWVTGPLAYKLAKNEGAAGFAVNASRFAGVTTLAILGLLSAKGTKLDWIHRSFIKPTVKTPVGELPLRLLPPSIVRPRMIP